MTRVGLEPGWWERLGPRRVGDGIWEAVRFAQSKRAMASLLARHLGLRPRSQNPVPGGVPKPAGPRDHDGSWSAMLRRIDGVLTDVEHPGRLRERLAAYEHERRVVAGAHGLLTVELEGSRILGLRVDERRLTAGNAERLGRDATDVLGRTTGPQAVAVLQGVLDAGL